jgi:MOSC domain-containing protein YiiM
VEQPGGRANCFISISHLAPVTRWNNYKRPNASSAGGSLAIGTYSPKPDVREVTLIEQEALDALSRNDPPLQAGPITLEPRDHRRNLTVIGVPLNHLVGRRFRVGKVILRGGRLNFPCKYLEEILGLPVFLPLYNRSGLNCGIERGGVIRPGDTIELLDQ